jgi:putative Holliday junction resolvase
VTLVASGIGRVLALDPGSKRVGVAVSDSGRTMAFPRPALAAGDGLVDAVRRLAEEEGAALVVVGLARSLSGAEGVAAEASRRLAAELEPALSELGTPVELHDERLTTLEASGAMSAAGRSKRSQRSSIDSAAATVLLESWLRAR